MPRSFSTRAIDNDIVKAMRLIFRLYERRSGLTLTIASDKNYEWAIFCERDEHSIRILSQEGDILLREYIFGEKIIRCYFETKSIELDSPSFKILNFRKMGATENDYLRIDKTLKLFFKQLEPIPEKRGIIRKIYEYIHNLSKRLF